MDTKREQRTNGRGSVGRAVARLQQHLRLQRQLLWHPRLGLVGARQPVTVRPVISRRRNS